MIEEDGQNQNSKSRFIESPGISRQISLEERRKFTQQFMRSRDRVS